MIPSVPDRNTPTGSVHVSIFKLVCSVFRGQQVVIGSEGNAWAAAELQAQTIPPQPASVCWLGRGPGGTNTVPDSQENTALVEEIKRIQRNEVVERDGAPPSQDPQVHTLLRWK